MSDYGTDGVGQNSGTRKNYSTSQPHQTDDTSLHLRKVSEIYESLRQDIVQRDGIIKYPYGLTDLDEKVGGLHKGELVVIAAEPSHGKSAFVVNAVKNLADKGCKVVYFSLEMKSEQIVERFLTNICEIDNQDLRFGRALHLVEQRESVFKSWLENVNLLIDDLYGFEIGNVEKVVNELEPDFVFIDYAQLTSVRAKTKTDAIEMYIGAIKQLCNINNIGAVVLSQLNRDESSSRMHRMKWSAALAEAPDVVLMLEWDWEKGIYKIRIDKNRSGMQGNIVVDFKPQYSKFADSDRPFYELPRKDLE